MRTHSMKFNRIDDEEVIVEVEFTMTARIPATYWDPTEGGEIEIQKAYLENGTEVKLTDAEYEKFERYIAENFEDDDDGSDEAYDAIRDERDGR